MADQSRDTAEDIETKDIPQPEGLVEFLRRSPLAKAIADGDIPPDAFERQREPPPGVDLSDVDPAQLNTGA